MKNKSAFVLFLLCLFHFAEAQSPTSIPAIIPPSPNAAAFQKYGNIPVSAYTGVPNISIPLYQIKEGDISVPISISYHSSGIKVAEESSRVGLGWILNAGGMISRNVIGADDFISSPNSYMNTASHTQPDIVNGIAANMSSIQVQFGCNINIPGFSDISNYLTNAPAYDFQPDQYYYNFLNHSGKYILKSSGVPILEKQEKINIQLLDPAGGSWQITTDDGMKYLFNQYETYTDFNAPGSPSAIKSAWYLTSISSPEGSQVSFQYSTSSNYINSIGGFSETQNPTVFSNTTPNGCNMFTLGSPNGTVRGPVPGKLYTNVYLDKIVFRSGEIRIVYADDRQDVQNDRRISSLQIYSYNASGVANLIKTWKFYQSYFSGSADQDYTLGIPVNYVTQRMKLDSVKEMDPNNNGLLPYQFHYNNESDVASTLPAKTSFARDHWGYYNGKIINSSLVPVYFAGQSSDPVVTAIGSMGDNRNTDTAYSSLFELNKILYPTGGNTQFQFESNDFDIAKSNKNDFSWYNTSPENRSLTERIRYDGNIVDQPSTDPADIASKTLDLSDLYVDPQTPTSPVSLSAFFRFNQAQTTCTLPQYYGLITFSLVNAATNQEVDHGELFTYLGASSQPMSACVSGSGNKVGILFSNTYSLVPGNYIWKLHIDASVTVIADVSLTVNFLGIAAAVSPTDIGGGLRIKRIIENDNFGINPPRVKHYVYDYTDAGGVLHSYGRRMSRPVYSYVQRDLKEEECDYSGAQEYFFTTFQRVMYGSDSNVPLNGSASGSVVGYDTVSEFIGENGESGKNTYIYKNLPDIILDYSNMDVFGGTSTLYRIPRRPPAFSTINFPDNGNLLEEIHFANINGNFFKAKDITNTYTYQTSQTQWQWYGIDIRRIQATYIGGSPPCNIDDYVYPAINSCWVTPLSTTETTYSLKNTGTVLTKNTTYYYENPAHMQLTRKFETLSNGSTRTTEFTYPADYSDAQSDAATLSMKTDRYMHSSIVSKTQYITKPDASQWVTDGMLQKYKIANGILVPAEVATLNISSPQPLAGFPSFNPASGAFPSGYESKLIYDQYDNYGNPLQIHKTNDVIHSFIWDYHNSNPIAEVTNADISTIAFTSFEADGSGNWVVGSPLRNTSSFLTGNNGYTLGNGNITKAGLPSGLQYIVSYWSVNGPANVNGVSAQTGPARRGWTYYEHLLPSTTTQVTVSGTATIDELRLYPAAARMTSYTYLPLVGISSSCDVNNHISFNEYDGFGRLRLIRDQDGNILKTFEYHYHNTQTGF